MDAHLHKSSTGHTANATINNVPTEIHFSIGPARGDITWQGNDGRVHRVEERTIDSVDLADLIVETLINPA